MSTQKKIIIDNITKIYNMYNSPMDRLKEAFNPKKTLHTEFFALKNVSFDVMEGEIVGIMGRNGAGKSTLLKIITGVLQPTWGEVSVSGRISSLLELGAGFNYEYTGIENIYFYGTIMGLTKAEIDAKVDEIISFAEIGDFVYQPVKSYSSGMFARLAFSCAINVEPEILIVDEILSVGDLRFQSKCFKKFKEFKKKGVTILYVGHDIATMRSFCDRCIWMNQGEIVDSGDPAYISAQYMEFMFLDDASDFTTYKALKKEKEEAAKKEEEKQKEDTSADTLMTLEKPAEDGEVEARMKNGKPLAHWGKKTGLINDISMTVDGVEVGSCDPRDTVTLAFSIPYIEDIDYEKLSVSFSIKNREGLDLVVKTTYESGIRLSSPNQEGHRFKFIFQPRLANGDYYLALGVENRTEAGISYYEYIEGAKYFKLYENKLQYCMFLPDIDIAIDGESRYEPEQ